MTEEERSFYLAAWQKNEDKNNENKKLKNISPSKSSILKLTDEIRNRNSEIEKRKLKDIFGD